MRNILRVTSAALSLLAAAAAEDLTIEALYQADSLSGPSLRRATFSPDGRLVTLLRGSETEASKLDLWAYDVESGEANVLVRADDVTGADTELSEEEKNRRERQRIYDTGIIDYAWDRQGKQLLFPIGGDVYLYTLADQQAKNVTETDAFETDAKISPRGQFLSYVRDDELIVYDIGSDRERQVTNGADGSIRNAVAEFVAQEELDRDTGYWWSPDEEYIAHTQIDESPVAIAERLDFSADGTKTIRQRYPFAGTDNVRIRLGITTPRGGRTIWAELGSDANIYLADAVWARNGSTLYVLRLSRDQQTLDVLAVNPETGQSRIILTETSETWVNLRGGLRPLPDGHFLWESERSGFNHLYLYAADGRLIRQLTEGDWPVSQVECVNIATNTIYFAGWRTSALEQHVFKLNTETGEINQLTETPGWHSAGFDGKCARFLHRYSSDVQPPQVSLETVEDGFSFWLVENQLDDTHPYTPYKDSHLAWTYGTLTAEDGQELDYRVLWPEGHTPDTASPAPAIQLVYGGPHVQQVANRWRSLYPQYLADQGYVVFQLDNRGAWNRGKAFEDVIYQQMGQPEVTDQALGTKWLASQPGVDGDRIGVQGWSYGGYMTLMMLGQQPDLYAAGVAGAPVTDWRTYDTAYTERYMGDPREGSAAYDAASVLTYARGIKDDALLLIHGMADDNVIFQNSIDLMAALQTAGTDFELMTYPGEKHGFRQRKNRIHYTTKAVEFFNTRLKDE